MNARKILKKVLDGSKNVAFAELQTLAKGFGFRLARTSGSHHIYVHPDVAEVLNLQNVGGQAKPYQIGQFLRLVERYNLVLGDAR